VIKEIFSMPIYLTNSKEYLPETLSSFNSFNIGEYYSPELYGVSGFTTYYNSDASRKINQLIPNTLKFIVEKGKNYLTEIGYDIKDYNMYVESMWFSSMKEHSNHNFHMHTSLGNKNLILCGTYYLNIPVNSAPILFSRSEGEFFNQPNLPVMEENAYTRKFYSHDPKEGDLVLFLAETFHGVLGNKSSEGRNTLSFNIMIEKNGNN
jgi:uncharacterized protein (TIGR02466 family)